ncbi:MAG: methyltransferase domain-containing protein [Desulfomonile tiedjei]|nr:methyltransferase domain-containing protein [Desulfomonile tiedjei]
MEAHEYATLFEFESSYWWYRSLHSILIDTLRSLGVGDRGKVLDAGCGTGQNLVNVSEHIAPGGAYGFDFSHAAAPFWAKRHLSGVCLASINEIPFQSDTFDAAMSVDVLECDAVSEDSAYGELWRVVKPGGYIILVVPAYDWLMSPEHHKAVHASRRYSRSRLTALLRKQPVDLIRMTHLFATLLPAVAVYRLFLKYLAPKPDGPPRSELKAMHPAVNELLSGVMSVERRLVRRWDLPFGSSIMAVARKVG